MVASPEDKPSTFTAGAPRKAKSFYEHLATIASLTGLVVAFVAALGFPSAILQFSRLGLPIEFLSYDRSLRAGIVPTVVFLVADVILLGLTKLLIKWVGRLRQRDSFRNGELSWRWVSFP